MQLNVKVYKDTHISTGGVNMIEGGRALVDLSAAPHLQERRSLEKRAGIFSERKARTEFSSRTQHPQVPNCQSIHTGFCPRRLQLSNFPLCHPCQKNTRKNLFFVVLLKDLLHKPSFQNDYYYRRRCGPQSKSIDYPNIDNA